MHWPHEHNHLLVTLRVHTVKYMCAYTGVKGELQTWHCTVAAPCGSGLMYLCCGLVGHDTRNKLVKIMIGLGYHFVRILRRELIVDLWSRVIYGVKYNLHVYYKGGWKLIHF